MRRLTDHEQHVLNVLVRRGSVCLGDLATTSLLGADLHDTLKSLVRKKRAYAEDTDDGPAFYPTQAGRNDATA